MTTKKVFFGPRVHCNTRSKRKAIISIFKLQLQLQLQTKINQKYTANSPHKFVNCRNHWCTAVCTGFGIFEQVIHCKCSLWQISFCLVRPLCIDTWWTSLLLPTLTSLLFFSCIRAVGRSENPGGGARGHNLHPLIEIVLTAIIWGRAIFSLSPKLTSLLFFSCIRAVGRSYNLGGSARGHNLHPLIEIMLTAKIWGQCNRPPAPWFLWPPFFSSSASGL